MEETREITVLKQQNGINIFGSIEGFEAGQRMAQVFATSSFVPDSYKNNIGNCLIALNMAMRMKADPLMVLQNLVAVQGKPTFEAKFSIACFNATGKYTSISYQEVGEKGNDNYGMYAYAVELKTGEVKKGPTVTIQMAKNEGWYARNPKWKNIPELMLRYRAASWFIRTTDPGIMMGFLTRDEAEDADFVELPTEKTQTQQMSESEKLMRIQQKEEQQANSEHLDMKIELNNKVDDKTKKKELKKEKEKDKVEPMGKQELPDMFK